VTDDWSDRFIDISRHTWAALGVKHLSYNSTVKVADYYFQPRALTKNGFMPSINMKETTKAYIPNADTDSIGDDMAMDKNAAG
jgi:hypothetical protein